MNKGDYSFHTNTDEIIESIMKIKREFIEVKICTMNAELVDEKDSIKNKGAHIKKDDIDNYNSKAPWELNQIIG